MENLSFVKNGALRLPPGFRFHPTDEELVVQYLKKKVFSYPLPASVIPDVDVCKFDPWDLPGELEQERYFFSSREAKYPNGRKSKRATASGHWKATGIERKILTSNENQLVGLKRTLVFYRGKSPNGSRTDWIMHEYRLSNGQLKERSPQNSMHHEMENWVLCRIFLKKRGRRERDDKICKPVFHEFLRKKEAELNVAPSPSSGSSGVTEISINDHEEDEETSRYISFP